MNRNEIERTVLLAVAEEISRARQLPIEPSDLDTDRDLAENGVDSLKAITIMFTLEDKLGIEIGTDAIETVRTVNDIVDVVAGLLGE